MNHERCDIMEFWETSTAGLLLLSVYSFSRYVLLMERFWCISISFIFPVNYDVYGV